MSTTIISDYKSSLEELATRNDNVSSWVEGIVASPQPQYKGPPAVPSVFGTLVDPNGGQEAPLPPARDSHVTRRCTAGQWRSGSTMANAPSPAPYPVPDMYTTSGISERPPPAPDEVRAPIDYNGDLITQMMGHS